MNVASSELCKELYELTGWQGTGEYWNRDTYNVNPREDFVGDSATGTFKSIAPAYDLGYLLRKLPDECTSKKIGGYHYFYLHHGKNTWIAYYGQIDTTEFMAGSDTPEDACAKLAIALIKQGILTPKG